MEDSTRTTGTSANAPQQAQTRIATNTTDMPFTPNASDTWQTLLTKGGLMGLMIALVGGILYMAHTERVESERHSKELIQKMIERCVPQYKDPGTALRWDRTWRQHELAQIERTLEQLDHELYTDD